MNRTKNTEMPLQEAAATCVSTAIDAMVLLNARDHDCLKLLKPINILQDAHCDTCH